MHWLAIILIITITITSITLWSIYLFPGNQAGWARLRRNTNLSTVVFFIVFAIAFILGSSDQQAQFDLADLYYLIFILGVTAWLLSWPYRQRAAGGLRLAVGRTLQNKLILWVAGLIVAFAISMTWLLVREMIDFPEYSPLLEGMIKVIFCWALALYFLGMGLSGFEIRDQGICLLLVFIPWQRISTYTWQTSHPSTLIIKFKQLPLLPKFISVKVPNHHCSAIDALLSNHIPHQDFQPS